MEEIFHVERRYTMFCYFFGDYLTKHNHITQSQFNEIIEYQKSLRVKLGIIAVSEKLLTNSQTDELNRLQSQMDKRFGDIAVEKGYLTTNQIEHLLSLQGNPYLQFMQALEDKNFMTLTSAEEHLQAYQKENNFTDSQIESLKSGDIDRIIPLFVNQGTPLIEDHLAIVLRTIFRLISTQLSFKQLCTVSEYSFDNLASQCLKGEHNIFVGIAGKGDTLLSIANPFALEEFDEIDEDTFDSVCEFINCVNGLFATKLSKEQIEVDMLPPIAYTGKTLTSNENIYVLPVIISGNSIDILVSADTAIDIHG